MKKIILIAFAVALSSCSSNSDQPVTDKPATTSEVPDYEDCNSDGNTNRDPLIACR